MGRYPVGVFFQSFAVKVGLRFGVKSRLGIEGNQTAMHPYAELSLGALFRFPVACAESLQLDFGE